MGRMHDALTIAVTDNWLTPREILDPLGPFDLDPCAVPEPRPWPTAARHIARPDDGLTAPWTGRVWLNPPYSTASRWVARLAYHGHGTALVFARTETRWFAEHVWRRADALLFLEGRVSFVRAERAAISGHNAPAPSVLVAYGEDDAARLAACRIPGACVDRWSQRMARNDETPLFDLAGEAS